MKDIDAGVVLGMIERAANRAELECCRAKDEADHTGHPDDKAAAAQLASKLYHTVQALDDLVLEVRARIFDNG